MKAYFKFRDNSKISTASAKGPGEVGVFFGIGARHHAVSGHQSKAFHVIAGKPVQPSQPAESTSENQPGGTRVRYDACGKGPASSSEWPCRSYPGDSRPRSVARRAARSTVTRRILERSITKPPSQVLKPARLCPPQRNAASTPRGGAGPDSRLYISDDPHIAQSDPASAQPCHSISRRASAYAGSAGRSRSSVKCFFAAKSVSLRLQVATVSCS